MSPEFHHHTYCQIRSTTIFHKILQNIIIIYGVRLIRTLNKNLEHLLCAWECLICLLLFAVALSCKFFRQEKENLHSILQVRTCFKTTRTTKLHSFGKCLIQILWKDKTGNFINICDTSVETIQMDILGRNYMSKWSRLWKKPNKIKSRILHLTNLCCGAGNTIPLVICAPTILCPVTIIHPEEMIKRKVLKAYH